MISVVTILCAAAVPSPLELYLIPHTHADVGWLQTVNSLSRMNVSRILDGVVGNLHNDTKKRRRFVWDEMAFLQLWWANQATTVQKAQFIELVKDGRIEFADNGWSQHDMGCTTLDSMLNNWVEGHEWIRANIGEAYMPKIGWSLDPFGMSATQAVLQAKMGMDAWFFTRVTDEIVDEMKQNKSLEFVWRASSSLPHNESEIFAHVWESYYCMPLPTYAFEWPASTGRIIPNATNVESLSHNLAKMAIDRSKWFRTPNVAIPWGCDYQYQNAALVYDSTDMLIDEINAHTAEWGVHAQYATPSEYLDGVRTSATAAKITFPVKPPAENFFPYKDWSGYFTSRPVVKGLSQQGHGELNAAEQLFALRDPAATDAAGVNVTDLWNELVNARRGLGVFQHHDAITGTFCAYKEGCGGVNQVIGSHDVLGSYEDILLSARASSRKVIAALAPQDSASSLFMEVAELGNILMGDGDGGEEAIITVYNQLAHTVTEAITLQVPVCKVGVRTNDAASTPILSQTTAMFNINDGIAPFFDFSLSFIAEIPPLGWSSFVINPHVDGVCGGADTAASTSSSAAQHTKHVPHAPGGEPEGADSCVNSAEVRQKAIRELQRHPLGLMGEPDEWQAAFDATVARMCESSGAVKPPPAPAPIFALENKFLQVTIDPASGMTSVLDKQSGVAHALTHELVKYAEKTQRESAGPAYTMQVTGDATPLLSGNRSTPLAVTSALGPVMQEARIQVSAQHKTRIRLWVTNDETLGKRIEFGHRIGVLEPFSEIVSRWTMGDTASSKSTNTTFYSEDNGYERMPHGSGINASFGKTIEKSHYPSQVSAYLVDAERGGVQLSLALERSHGVASLSTGVIDVVQHRRATPYPGSGGTVVLDDSDRIFTETWVSIGETHKSNQLRAENKLRLNRKVTPVFGKYEAKAAAMANDAAATPAAAAPLPRQLHLQTVRATSATGEEMIVRLQHVFAEGEDPTLSVPVHVDIAAFVKGILPAGVKALPPQEMTLDGAQPIAAQEKRRHFPTAAAMDANAPSAGASRAATSVRPFELKTYRVAVGEAVAVE